MADSVPFLTLQAIAAQLAVISIATGYNTNLGVSVRIHGTQRSEAELPSIAIGSRSGEFNLAADGVTSPRARRMAIIIEPAMVSAFEDEERVAHLMLEDIECAFARNTRYAPFSVRGVVLETWSIVDRPEGSNAVVLQILGTAEYLRSQPTPAIAG